MAVGHIHLTTTLEPPGPAAAVVLDAGQVAAVGEGAKRFPVVATVNGNTWRTTVTRMRGEFLAAIVRGARRALRRACGARPLTEPAGLLRRAAATVGADWRAGDRNVARRGRWPA